MQTKEAGAGSARTGFNVRSRNGREGCRASRLTGQTPQEDSRSAGRAGAWICEKQGMLSNDLAMSGWGLIYCLVLIS